MQPRDVHPRRSPLRRRRESLLVPLVRVDVLVLWVQVLHFFLRMRRAAASARAFSFRVSSRSRLRIRRVSAVEPDSRPLELGATAPTPLGARLREQAAP